MQVIVAKHSRALEILEAEPNQIDVIFISSPNEPYSIEGSSNIKDLAKECLVLLFNDVTISRKEMSPPQKEDIQKALEFAKGRKKVLVSCQAGISRSSSIAYLIAAQEVGITEAFNVLDPVHIPNKLIIAHGAAILNEPNMVELMDCWKNKNDIFG